MDIKLNYESPFISDRLVDIVRVLKQHPDQWEFWFIGTGIITKYYDKPRTIYINEDLGYTWEDRKSFKVMRAHCGMFIEIDEQYYFISKNAQDNGDPAFKYCVDLENQYKWYIKFITKQSLV